MAAVSGDARRALDICRRSTEIAEQKSDSRVDMVHVNAALQEMFSNPKTQAIRYCTRHTQQCVVNNNSSEAASVVFTIFLPYHMCI